MKIARNVVLCLLTGCVLSLSGCGKKTGQPAKADETKPLSEVKAEAEGMDVKKLKAMTLAYQDAIMVKKGEADRLMAKFKDIPVAKLMGEEANEVKAELDALGKSMSALSKRFQLYYDKLKEKGGDLSGLKI